MFCHHCFTDVERLRKVKLLANYDTAGKKQISDLILAVSDFKICDLRLGFKAQFS